MPTYNHDPFKLDQVDPEEGATEAEIMLAAGKCPYCEDATVFNVSEEYEDAIVCRGCGFEFSGVRSSRNWPRVVTAVYRSGRTRGPERVVLPEVTAGRKDPGGKPEG